MKTKVALIITLQLALACFATRAQASIFTRDYIGTTSAQFLKLGTGARPAAMGEAFTGLADDINAIYWNPAGLVNVHLKEAVFMKAQWFEGISFNWAAYAQPALGGKLGLGLFYLGSGDIPKYDNAGNSQNDTYSDYDSALNVSYARTINNIPLGVTLKVLHSKLEDESATGLAADVGMMKKIPGRLDMTAGISVQNIGYGLKYVKESSPLPLTLRTGVSFRVLKSRLLVSSDLEFPADNELSLHAGAEYDYGVGPVRLLPRIGYKTNTIKDMNAMSGLSVGFGVAFGDMSVNYAWVPYWEFGGTSRIDVGYKFGRPVRPKAAKSKPEPVYVPEDYECVECVNVAARSVHFDFGSFFVKDFETPILDTIAALLIKYDPYGIRVAGYCDTLEFQNLGPDLSQKRADFVMQYLITKGVPAGKLSALGYGKDMPANSDEVGRAANRRVEFIIKEDKEGKEERFETFASEKEKDSLINVHFVLGYSLFADNKFKEAIEEFKKVLVLKPDHSEAKQYLTKAEDILSEKNAMLPPDTIDMKLSKMRKFFKEGQELFIKKKYGESIQAFENVLRIDPMHVESKRYIIRARKELNK